MQKIGIYPGTFDPVHSGHIAFSLEALRIFDLDEVVFLPEALPRGKPTATVISKRILQLNDAIASVKAARVMNLKGSRFTVRETLPELYQLFGSSQLTLLVGSDVVQTFLYRWDDLDMLLGRMKLAIGMRAGDTPDEMIAIMNSLESRYNIPITYELVFTQYDDVSSSRLKNVRA